LEFGADADDFVWAFTARKLLPKEWIVLQQQLEAHGIG
jgi:hypothetical protein